MGWNYRRVQGSFAKEDDVGWCCVDCVELKTEKSFRCIVGHWFAFYTYPIRGLLDALRPSTPSPDIQVEETASHTA